MLSGWQWLLLAIVPPAITVLYFLKLKRQPIEVPSTYLWEKSIEDLHVNSLWQRLRQSLLLWLQLLLLLLIMLALLNPTWRTTSFKGDRFIFIVDNSASMSSRDVVVESETITRLEAAKRRVDELIQQMDTGDAAMIISFSDNAIVVKEFTKNQHVLRREVAGIPSTARRTSLAAALRLAAGLANPGRSAFSEDEGETSPAAGAVQDEAAADAQPAEMFVLSDFKLPDVVDFSLGNLEPRLEMIGDPNSTNVAIVNLSTRRHDRRPDQIQALARIENYGAEAVTVALELFLDEELVDVQEAEVPGVDPEKPGTNFKQVVFALEDIETGILHLAHDYEDALRLDDEAWAVVNPPRRTRILFATTGNTAFESALTTSKARELADVEFVDPAVLTTKDHQAQADAGVYDFIIYDRCRPQKMPSCNTFFIGRVPPDNRWEPGDAIKGPQIIDTERTHPVMQLLDLGDVSIYQAHEVKPPAGGTVLIESQGGAIFAIAPREGYVDAVLGFEFQQTDEDGKTVYNTNWPLRTSFAVFIQDLIGYLANPNRKLASISIAPGHSHELHLPDGPEELKIIRPDGSENVVRNHQNRYSFTRTDLLGVYEYSQGGLTHRFTVNLFDPNESDIRPMPETSVRLGNTKVVGSARPDWHFTRYAIWKLLALLGLGVLLFEWYIYNRRVYV
ncbi:MAG: BatA and WFA domain-containing protein [Pirellulales bacterium]